MLPDKSIAYHMFHDKMPLFFSGKIRNLVNDLARSVNTCQHHIDVFPDATYKTPGLPNGLAITSDVNNAILFPTLLRDPGCGFLLFKIKCNTFDKNKLEKIKTMLVEGMDSKFGMQSRDVRLRYFSDTPIKHILYNGINSFSNVSPMLECFMYTSFPVKKNIEINDSELAAIEADILNVTNTIELKDISSIKPAQLDHIDINKNNIIGFIHSGSDVFPKILSARFYHRMVDEAQQSKLFSLKNIKKGIFGVPLRSSPGDEYYQWINLAMNFAIFNRIYIFLCVKELLETSFECEVSILNDKLHAGAFIHSQSLLSSRGVQVLDNHDQHSLKNVYLMAGHRETVSALIEALPPVNNNINLISHGSSYEIVNHYNYAVEFEKDEVDYYLSLAHNAFYNTDPRFDQCIPYTFNLLTSLNYFHEHNKINLLAILQPLINIQSSSLVRRLCAFEQLQKSNTAVHIPWMR